MGNFKKKVFIIVIALLIFCLLEYQYIIVKKYADQQLLYLTIATIILIIIEVLIIFHIINSEKMPIEKVFLYVAPMFCILMLIAIPIGNAHDEFVHYEREYGITEGQLVINNNVKIPRAIVQLFKVNEKTTASEVQTYLSSFANSKIQIDNNDKVSVNIYTDAVYHPIQFTNTVIGILFAKLFTNNALGIAYVGRIFNVIISIIILYYAIKKIPFAKNIVFLCSIIPISIECFSTLSSDGLTIAICYLFISYILKLAFDKDIILIRYKEVTRITLLATIIACCKIVYLPLIFLILIIPKEKYINKKDKIIKTLVVILIPMAINIIWLVTSMSILETRNGQPTEQIKNALHNPIGFLQMILYTIYNNIDRYILTGFGDKLEQTETVKITLVSIILFIISIFMTIADNTIKDRFSKKQKRIIRIILFIIVVLIFCSLYVQWTTKKSVEIQGIQGRYFLPIFPLIVMLLGDIKVKSEYSEKNMANIIAGTSLLTQSIVIMELVMTHL